VEKKVSGGRAGNIQMYKKNPFFSMLTRNEIEPLTIALKWAPRLGLIVLLKWSIGRNGEKERVVLIVFQGRKRCFIFLNFYERNKKIK